MEEPWTGTNPGGTSSGIALTCQDWADGTNANLASTGDTSTANANGWVNANGWNCGSVRPLYCIEE